jgi:hypothetical protein
VANQNQFLRRANHQLNMAIGIVAASAHQAGENKSAVISSIKGVKEKTLLPWPEFFLPSARPKEQDCSGISRCDLLKYLKEGQ